MVFGRKKTGNWFYIGLAIFILVLILLTTSFSTNTLYKAYIDDRFLVGGWFESGERIYKEQLFGLEKQSTFNYKFDSISEEKYTAFLTITSIKTIFMINEQELLDKTIKTIYNAVSTINITVINSSQFIGSRFLKNGHNTFFIVLNGTKLIDDYVEKVKIIGETWNCPYSGSSVICIGIAQTTDVKNDNNSENFINWAKIIGDEKGTFYNLYSCNDFLDSQGLIFNVKCH